MGNTSCRADDRSDDAEFHDVAAEDYKAGDIFGKEERPTKIPKVRKAPLMQAALRQGQGESSLTSMSSCTASSISSPSQVLDPVSPTSPGIEDFWPERSGRISTVARKPQSMNVLMEMARQISSGEQAGLKREALSGVSPELMQEFQRAVSATSDVSIESTKKEVQRTWRRLRATTLFLTCTMGSVPSASLQLVINNPGKVDDFYKILDKVLGKGSFGQVISAKVTSTGAERAIKVISKALMKEHMGTLRDEIDIMKQVDHQNAVTLYEVFEDEASIFLVMELCSGGDLEAYVTKNRKLDEKSAAAAMQQVLRAVHHLHAKHICHRDLKCSNLLLMEDGVLIEEEDNSIKVADYGLSTHFRPGKLMTQTAGTDTHMAPEVREKSYTQACDLWSAGVCMYFLLSVGLPFSTEQIEAKKFSVRFSSAAWADVSQEAVDLLGNTGLLTLSKTKRPTAQAALRHKWILNNCKAVSSVKVPISVLQKLVRHRSQNRFKQACLSVVASFLSRKATASERRYFFAMDTRGNGLIPMAGIYKRLREENEEDIDIPLNTNASDISFMEFIAATFDRKRCLNQKLCKTAFSVFDRNGDGNISLSEIIGGRLLGSLSADEVFQTLEDLDKNGDSQIDFKEFTDMLRSE